jgi:hypothetical protein
LRPTILEEELERLKIEGDPFMSWMAASGISPDKKTENTVEVHQDAAMESFRQYCLNNGYNTWAMRKFKGRLRDLNLQESGKHGGKHSFVFYVTDLKLAKISRVIPLVS